MRIAEAGGEVVLNYRARGRGDTVLNPMSKLVRGLFSVPRLGDWLSRKRIIARIGWQANRLNPDEIIGPLAPLFSSVEVWRNPKSNFAGRGAVTRSFIGVNPHHYWVIATVR